MFCSKRTLPVLSVIATFLMLALIFTLAVFQLFSTRAEPPTDNTSFQRLEDPAGSFSDLPKQDALLIMTKTRGISVEEADLPFAAMVQRLHVQGVKEVSSRAYYTNVAVADDITLQMGTVAYMDGAAFAGADSQDVWVVGQSGEVSFTPHSQKAVVLKPSMLQVITTGTVAVSVDSSDEKRMEALKEKGFFAAGSRTNTTVLRKSVTLNKYYMASQA